MQQSGPEQITQPKIPKLTPLLLAAKESKPIKLSSAGWFILGLVIGAVISLGSVLIFNKFIFESKPLEVTGNSPIPAEFDIPTPDVTPQISEEPIIVRNTKLDGDFCTGYTVQTARCLVPEPDLDAECENIDKTKYQKPYCKLVNTQTDATIIDLPIKIDGGYDTYGFQLGKETQIGTYIIETITSDDGVPGFEVYEFTFDTNTLSDKLYQFVLTDKCLEIIYKPDGSPAELTMTTNAEIASLCPPSKLTPELKGQFAELLNHY